MNVRCFLPLVGVVFLFPGCATPKQILGNAPDVSHLAVISDSQKSKGAVTLRGKMIEKCPTAACWFRLRDKSGVAKVDVKGAYFTVTDVPVNAEVTVSGVWREDNGSSTFFATGLSY